jgi:hypothetical protein
LAETLMTTEEWLLWEDGPEEAAVDETAEILAILRKTPPERRRVALRLLRNWVATSKKTAS